MRVDQARHQDAAGTIHYVHRLVRFEARSNPADQPVCHQHIQAFAQHFGIAVKDARVAKKNPHVGSISHCEDLGLKDTHHRQHATVVTKRAPRL